MWDEYSGSIESSRIYHERYHKAVNHPLRRRILKLIAEGVRDERGLMERLGISKSELDYHLRVLEWGFCVKRRSGRLELTKEGEVVEYLED